MTLHHHDPAAPRRGQPTLGALATVAAAAALAACGASNADYAGGDDDDPWGDADAGAASPECFSASECPVGWTCSEFGFCVPPPDPGDDGGVPEPPPEVEYELGAPVSSNRFVWVTMTEKDAVAKIDGETLEVVSIGVGESPEEMVTMPGSDTAVVLDHVNGAAAVIRPAAGSEIVDLEPTLPNLNHLAASPSGTRAVAFFDLIKAIAEAGSLDAVEDVGSFQDVTIVGLDAEGTRTVDLTVGFRPREIEFDEDGERAYVITDDGVSVIDLTTVFEAGPVIIPPIPVTSNPFEDASGLEVEIVAAGDLAVVREPGQPWLRVVRLTGVAVGTSWEVTLPGVPSDMELSPDGARAYLVLRETAQLAVLDVPADLQDPAGIELVDLADATLGSLTLTADGARGVLYTNAALDERLTVIELDQPGYPHVTYPLEKSVRAVGISPGGAKLIVLHARAPGDPGDATTFDEFIDRSFGYSVVDVATGFAKLQITPVDPGNFAFAGAQARAYVVLDGGDAEGALAAVQEVELDTGVVRWHYLGSPPDEVGVLPSTSKVFVSQRHPLGRVTFIDVATGQARTLTGFDLNSQVID